MTSEDLATFIERRRRFVEGIGEGLAIIPAAQETARNSDVSHVFRQNSDFFFLTGFDEPDAVAVFNPAHSKERFVLFVRPRDREMEIWNGRRAGVEGAVAQYGADAAYPVDQLDAKLREYAIDRTTLYYRLGNSAFDSARDPAGRPTAGGAQPRLRHARARRGPGPDPARAAAAPLARRARARAARLPDQP